MCFMQPQRQPIARAALTRRAFTLLFRRFSLECGAGTVSIRAGPAVLVTMHVGELVGERSFWGQGNRGKAANIIAETDVEVQWLEFEVRFMSPS